MKNRFYQDGENRLSFHFMSYMLSTEYASEVNEWLTSRKLTGCLQAYDKDSLLRTITFDNASDAIEFKLRFL